MEVFSTGFLSALAAIVVIDLVLAGDNAIVIALAARSLPAHLRKRAIVWGAVGAIAVRSTLTMVVVWLLKIPGLLLIGGALLIWIAYRLLIPDADEGAESGARPASGFWGAMRTIVVADTLMGLDNVLAVAGAAHGSYLLVTLGLLISIPIVIWGSTMILRFVERHPGFVYLGAAVLAGTAMKMMLAEPLVKHSIAINGAATALAYVLVVGAVLWAGFVHNHRRLESRISARLASFAGQRLEDAAENSQPEEGESPMFRVLVPVDGSRNAERAVRHVLGEFLKGTEMEIHLLNVQPPFSRHISQFVSRRNVVAFHREQAETAIQPARGILDGHRVPYVVHAEVGKRAQVIAETARRLRCHHIVMSTARKNSLTRMIEDSVTNRVLELTSVPVEVIAGDEISKLERYGIPAGIAATLAALVLAVID